MYDEMRRPYLIIGSDPDGEGGSERLITRTFYDLNGRETRIVNRAVNDNGAVLSITETDYSLTGQPIFTYDSGCFSLPSGIRNLDLAGCGITETRYDALDRPEIVIDPVGRQIKTVYDPAGQVEQVIRAYGSRQIDGNGETLEQVYQEYTYSDSGQVLSVTDANHNKTEYFYDGFDRLKKTQFPNKAINAATKKGNRTSSPSDYEEYTYDNNGNILTQRMRSGGHIVNIYDALNRVTNKKVYSAAIGGISENNVDYGYDKASRETFVHQLGGGSHGVSIPDHLVEYRYDSAGRLETEIQGNRYVGMRYDAAGNRTKLLYPRNPLVAANESDANRFAVDFEYDALNRMDKVTALDPQAANDNYVLNYEYDALSRPELKRFTGSAGTAMSNYMYYTDSTLRSIMHDVPEYEVATRDVTFSYRYTKANQIENKVITNPVYIFEENRNSSATYVVNGLNQYTSISETNAATAAAPEASNTDAYSYDDNGNLTSDGEWNHYYDTENRLVKSQKAGKTVEYQYDGKGRRLSKTDVTLGVRTEYLYEGDEPIADIAVTSGAQMLARRYVNGASIDERVFYFAYSQSTGARTVGQYYHANHQGSIVAMTGAEVDGTAAITYSYNAFGNSPSGELAGGQPFRYTGRRYDSETGLYYYRARYYSAKIGRFLQVDPIGYEDQQNLYAYVNNDPVNSFDPNGEATITLKGKLGGKIGGLLRNATNAIFGSDTVQAGGVAVAAGVAISFPLFDGAEFDAGIIGNADITDISQSTGQSLPSLPGASAGALLGFHTGSVSDLAGKEQVSFKGEINIGKKLSNTIVDGVASLLPDGKAKNFIKGPVRNVSNAALGLVGSVTVTENGVELGLAKGLNAGVSADLGVTGVCSVQLQGCTAGGDENQ